MGRVGFHFNLTVVLALAIAFAAGALACGVYAFLPDSPWYKYTSSVGITILETFESVKDGVLSSDDLIQLYSVCNAFMIVGFVCEVVILFFLVIFVFVKIKLGPLHGRRLKSIVHLISVVATLAFLFSVLYFLRHMSILNEHCPINTGPCTSFAGSQTGYSWGPGQGWIVGVVAAGLALIDTVILAKTHHHSDYTRLD